MTDEPAYSPKLKAAMEEIKAILRKHDIAGVVALHTPEIISGVDGASGAGEYLLQLTPTYSAVEWTPDRSGFIIKGNKFKHYGGDAKIRDKKLRDTLNMLRVLTDLLGPSVLRLIDINEHTDRVWNAQHPGGEHTPHQAPLN